MSGSADGVWHAVNGMAGLASLYVGLETLIAFLGAKIFLPRLFPGMSKVELDARYGDMLTVGAVLISFLVVLTVRWPVIFGRDLHGDDHVRWSAGRRMTPLVFVICLAFLVLAQVAATFFQDGVDALAGRLGLPASPSSDGTGPSSLLMLFYAVVMGPLVEEVVFRGVIMNRLRRYGRVFAIVTSAVLFGFMHESLAQGLFGMLTGLMMGYVAMEHGLVWSLVLHMVNNLVFSDLPSTYLPLLPAPLRLVLLLAASLVFLTGLAGLVGHGRVVLTYCRTYRAVKGVYASWLSPWFLVFCLGCLVLAVGEYLPGLH